MLATIFNWSIAWQYRGQLLAGFAVAVEVAAVALAISVVVGIILALGRMSKPPVSWLATLVGQRLSRHTRTSQRACGSISGGRCSSGST